MVVETAKESFIVESSTRLLWEGSAGATVSRTAPFFLDALRRESWQGRSKQKRHDERGGRSALVS